MLSRDIRVRIQIRNNDYCFIQPLLQFRATFIGYSCRNPDAMACRTIEKLIGGNLHLFYTQAPGIGIQTGGAADIIVPTNVLMRFNSDVWQYRAISINER